MAKNYEELTITDDFMFGKVMEDKVLCHDLLECLLGQPVGELQDVQSERRFRYPSDGKPIRLDVYTGDNEHTYDTEMQNLNHHTIEELELPKRSAKYSFENRCREESELVLSDGTEKFFFNCSCRSEDVPEELRALYEYIQEGKVNSELTGRLEEAVEKARRNEKWRSEYVKELILEDDIREEGRAEGREEGRAEGREEGRAEERANTEREKARADALEAKVRELEAIIKKQA